MPTPTPLSSLTRLSSTVKDLFTQLYGLSHLELELLLLLYKKKQPMTLDQISQETDRDRTTVFRSLQKLVNEGICNKDTKTIKDGGYYHTYSAIDMETFQLETEKRVNELKNSLDRILNKFKDDLNNAIASL